MRKLYRTDRATGGVEILDAIWVREEALQLAAAGLKTDMVAIHSQLINGHCVATPEWVFEYTEDNPMPAKDFLAIQEGLKWLGIDDVPQNCDRCEDGSAYHGLTNVVAPGTLETAC